ncbi:molecular chaperone DnaJ [Pseudoroseomonas wenyumeiae]|uniref:Molecular chaperone DnaJ n=1 Tax=Teichococcus wenyumeiae TaxID=2478470 RepID=A0A3A9JEA8_9PROT|nr:J domain-containing protein [Pseudoroseomonas wenyumeiae]RKK04570.1 molecular chaperone DnaJ [Pseudoroseomonas wenyumeiae]RMI20866.1 molecular chaperone DnaJ [Pseudoroseomonas wenyumeiae]
MARRGERPRFDKSPPPSGPPCDAPGCEAVGEFRAPRDRSRLRDYYHFCLEHVRAYNQAWDYYKGMSATEIENNLRDDSGWQRPTWPLGRLGNTKLNPEIFHDPLGLFGQAPPTPRKSAKEAPPELRAALDLLGLGWPLEESTLRARYKELAKRYHPDSNGGDRSFEDKMKDINRAYSLLRKRLAAAHDAGTPSQEASSRAA